MGETQNQPFQLSFNASLKVDFQGSRVTSDGGLILVRELDERLGFSELIDQHLTDSQGKNTQLPLADLLRQSVYSRLAGYEDLNDAARLSADPTFRLIGSEKVWEQGAALTSTLHWFETDLLAREENLTGLARLYRELVAEAEGVGSSYRVVLDMDSVRARSMASRNRALITDISGQFGHSCAVHTPSQAFFVLIWHAPWLQSRETFHGAAVLLLFIPFYICFLVYRVPGRQRMLRESLLHMSIAPFAPPILRAMLSSERLSWDCGLSAGKDGWPVGQTCPALLAVAG